jgi:salicylate hydroxylase
MQCESINLATKEISFSNGTKAQHDLIVGADGIGSITRKIIGLNPEKRPAESSCLHANVMTRDVRKLGLVDYSLNSALEYWGGQEGKWDKIVLSPCNGGDLLSYYCFFPRSVGDYANHTWGGADLPVEDLLAPYPELDEKVKAHLAIGIEVRPWRLWVHQPYPYVVKKSIALIGDAAHPVSNSCY